MTKKELDEYFNENDDDNEHEATLNSIQEAIEELSYDIREIRKSAESVRIFINVICIIGWIFIIITLNNHFHILQRISENI